MDNTIPPPKKRGCFFYGCISLAVICVIGAILAVITVRYGVRKANEAIAQYTDTQPAPIETVSVDPTELTNLQQRVESFKAALDKPGEAPQELVLTADQINALINEDPSFKQLAGKVQVMIEDEVVKGKVSIPLTEDLGPIKLKGRYLNGIATFNLSLENGRLQIHVDDMEVKGKPVPEPFLAEFRKQNLAEDAMRDRETSALISKFDTIKVQDGKVTLRSKGKL